MMLCIVYWHIDINSSENIVASFFRILDASVLKGWILAVSPKI